MPYVPKRRPLYTIVADAAMGVAAFGWMGLSSLILILPVVALCIGAILLLEGPARLGDWRPGAAELIPFAATIGVVFFAGLILATGERLASRGYVWGFEENAKCDERAIRFVEGLLLGKRRVAYGQLHDSARERTSLASFEAEWMGLDLPPDAKLLWIEPEAYFEEHGDAPPISPHRYGSRLRTTLRVVDVACRIEEGGRVYQRNVRVDLVRAGDDWFVVGWQIGAEED
jgi:hypothetical protein